MLRFLTRMKALRNMIQFRNGRKGKCDGHFNLFKVKAQQILLITLKYSFKQTFLFLFLFQNDFFSSQSRRISKSIQGKKLFISQVFHLHLHPPLHLSKIIQNRVRKKTLRKEMFLSWNCHPLPLPLRYPLTWPRNGINVPKNTRPQSFSHQLMFFHDFRKVLG